MANFLKPFLPAAPLVLALAALCQTVAAQIPKLHDVPVSLSDSPRYSEWTNAQATLLTLKAGFFAAAKKHNAKCGNVTVGTALAEECARDWQQLEEQRKSYSADVEKFNQSLAIAVAAHKAASVLALEQSQNGKLSDASNFPGVNLNDLELKTVALAERLSASLLDSSAVDARNVPSGLPQSVEEAIPQTPAGARVRKGFQAALLQDWKVALAWFQDALNHEPGNPELQKLVDSARSALAKAQETKPDLTREMLHALASRDSERTRKASERDAMMSSKLAQWRSKPGEPISEDLMIWMAAQRRPATKVDREGQVTDEEIIRLLAKPRPNAVAVELEQIRKSLASAFDEIETAQRREIAVAWLKSFEKMGNVFADLKAKGLWKDSDASLDRSKLDLQVQRALTEAGKRILNETDVAEEAIAEQTRKKLFEAGHQILTLGNTSWTPSQSSIRK